MIDQKTITDLCRTNTGRTQLWKLDDECKVLIYQRILEAVQKTHPETTMKPGHSIGTTMVYIIPVDGQTAGVTVEVTSMRSGTMFHSYPSGKHSISIQYRAKTFQTRKNGIPFDLIAEAIIQQSARVLRDRHARQKNDAAKLAAECELEALKLEFNQIGRYRAPCFQLSRDNQIEINMPGMTIEQARRVMTLLVEMGLTEQ